MDSRKLNVVKMENQNEFDWLYLEEKLQGMLEQPSAFTDGFEHYLDNFFEFDPCPFPYQNSHIAHFEFKDFEYVNGDCSFWDTNIPSFDEDIGVDNKLLNPMTVHFDHSNSVGTLTSEVPASIQRDFASSRQSGRSKSAAALELDEIQKYFDVPITKAAKELKVGLTVLKKRCRELNIMRWPHRKIKSLKSLIDNVKELGLTTEIEMLEEHRKMLEKLPELELTERTKKLRQACFKANYKKRRSLAALSNV